MTIVLLRWILIFYGLIQIASKEQYHYKIAYTISKQVLEEFKYDGCSVLVYPPVSQILRLIFPSSDQCIVPICTSYYYMQ